MRLTPHPQIHHRSPQPRRSGPRNRFPLAPSTGVVGAAVLGAVVVMVVTADPAQASTQVLALASSVGQVFDNVRNWLVGILAGLATVFLTLGGVRYLMTGGDPGEVEKAKTAFKSAGWGYGLAALAPLVVEILKGIVGA